jgi:hypothetical protein
MICEKCQVNEATVHLTHCFPLQPVKREPARVFEQHFCESCGSVFNREYEEFVQKQPECLRRGMSKQERWEATRPLREALERYVKDWGGSGHSS